MAASESIFAEALNETCVDGFLLKYFDVNPKIWYDFKASSILPQTGTYGEFLKALLFHYRDRQVAALAKIENTRKLEELKIQEKLNAPSKTRTKQFDTESGLSKLQEAGLIQKIKLDKAREEQIHIVNLRERGSLLEKDELLAVCQPVFANIANILRNASDSDPNFTPIVDKCFSSLYNVANRIASECVEDSEKFVREMLNREINIDALVEEGV